MKTRPSVEKQINYYWVESEEWRHARLQMMCGQLSYGRQRIIQPSNTIMKTTTMQEALIVSVDIIVNGDYVWKSNK